MRAMYHKKMSAILAIWLTLAIPALAYQPQRVCAFEGVTIQSDFSGGRVNACQQISETHYRLTIIPEDEPPINISPWYAFNVTAEEQKSITIDIAYSYHKHRYWPKFSTDLTSWPRFEADAVNILEDGTARLTLTVGPTPLYVAGQEILTYDFHTDWAKNMAQRPDLTMMEMGVSRADRPIYKLETSAPIAGGRDYIFLVGRQHPPEVTGALALVPFAEALFADTDLAKDFRSHFGVVIIPALNPDGVENGNWRHNLGGQDLNRDWGPFTQPETQLVRDELARFKNGDTLSLLLDFHSTSRNVLYTQADDEPTRPPYFAAKWTEAVKARVENYDFERAPRPVTELPTSKNYTYTTFGAAAITYEVGDETDRKAINDAAIIFAEEMMRILLADKAAQQD